MRKVVFAFCFLVIGGIFSFQQAHAASPCAGAADVSCWEKIPLVSLLDPMQTETTPGTRVEKFRVGFYRLLDNFADLRANNRGTEFQKKARAIHVTLLAIGSNANGAISAYNEGMINMEELDIMVRVQMARCQKLMEVHPELGG